MRTSTKEELRTAFQKAPAEIREAYLDERLIHILQELQTKYQIHIDIAGAISDQLGDLLLGLITPAEFYGNLVLLGTSEQTAKGIMDDLNRQIFLPLRDKMRARSEETKDLPVPDYSVPQVPVFPDQSSSAVSAPQVSTSESMPPEEPVSLPQIRTMAHDMASAKSGEGAHAPIPSAWATPPPAARPQITVSESSRPPIEPVVQQPPIEKTYGVDPYREPVQ